MTVHSFPKIRTLAPTMIVVLIGLIVDLNLKSIGFEYDFGSVSQRWLSPIYASLAAKLMHEVQQPESSAAAPISGTVVSAQDASRGFINQRSSAGVAAVAPAVGQLTKNKTSVCGAPAQAQFGQGNSMQADYRTPVKERPGADDKWPGFGHYGAGCECADPSGCGSTPEAMRRR